MIYQNKKQAQTACNEWAEVLYLSEWEIVVEIVQPEELDGDRQAQVEYSVAKKQALVKLLDPKHFSNKAFPQDHEKSLVHELIHLKLVWTDDLVAVDKRANNDLEFAVDSMARAFMRVKHQSRNYFRVGA